MKLNQWFAVATLPILITACALPSGQVFSKDAARVLAQNTAQPDSQPGQHRAPRRPDFAAAAAKLGVSEAQLKEALGVKEMDGQRRRPDLAAAAAKLGISEAQLKEAMGVNNTNGQRRHPDLKAAAAKLNISEQQLVQALGLPERPPRPDFAAAAAKLGVSEAQLKAALGVPANPPSGDRTQRPPRSDF